jgi:hypothetical protein
MDCIVASGDYPACTFCLNIAKFDPKGKKMDWVGGKEVHEVHDARDASTGQEGRVYI